MTLTKSRGLLLAILTIMVIGAVSFIPTTSASANGATIKHRNWTESNFFIRVDIPCANSGEGEEILLKGTAHIRSQIVKNGNNNHVTWTLNTMGLTGVGPDTGLTYHANRTLLTNVHGAPDNQEPESQYTSSAVIRLRIVSSETVSHSDLTLHVTYDANGNPRMFFKNISTGCTSHAN